MIRTSFAQKIKHQGCIGTRKVEAYGVRGDTFPMDKFYKTCLNCTLPASKCNGECEIIKRGKKS